MIQISIFDMCLIFACACAVMYGLIRLVGILLVNVYYKIKGVKRFEGIKRVKNKLNNSYGK